MAIVLQDYSWIYAGMGISLLLVLLHFYRQMQKRKEALKFANVPVLRELEIGVGGKRDVLQLTLKIAAVLLLCLAGGGLGIQKTVPAEHQNLVLALDRSMSMLKEDYSPTRLQAMKDAVIPFIDKLKGRTSVAVVSFGPQVNLIQNFTTNKGKLKEAVRGIEATSKPGTAIGDTLYFSANKIPERGGTIVLLTDGRINVGIMVEDALETVKNQGTTVHVVGVGSTSAEMSEINKETLKLIASETGGLSEFSETGVELKNIYEKISSITLRKKVKTKTFPLAPWLLIGALALYTLEAILSSTLFRVVP